MKKISPVSGIYFTKIYCYEYEKNVEPCCRLCKSKAYAYHLSFRTFIHAIFLLANGNTDVQRKIQTVWGNTILKDYTGVILM